MPRKNLNLAFITFLVLLNIIAGCQTPLYKVIDKVEPGMDKSQVLETLGSPKYTKQTQNYDHWKYEFYKDAVKMSKEILFFEDHVVKIKPTVYRPDLLDHAMTANDMNEYEKRIKVYRESKGKTIKK
ncbi:MAG: outer membrane protein assembly factor BamE [Bdellovibrionales bacterium]|nr:outer membrane protein assembly factor BamE [Bdellovibrionales bacterium]